jgi:hypothetical protein
MEFQYKFDNNNCIHYVYTTRRAKFSNKITFTCVVEKRATTFAPILIGKGGT